MLGALDRPMTVSVLWDTIRSCRSPSVPNAVVDYRWFVLTLDLLYLIGAVKLERGLIHRANV